MSEYTQENALSRHSDQPTCTRKHHPKCIIFLQNIHCTNGYTQCFVLFFFLLSRKTLCANVWRTKISLSIKSLSLIKDKRKGKPKGSWFSLRNILLACCIYLLHKLMWFIEIKHFMNFFQRWLAKSFGNCCDHSEQNALHYAQRADAVDRLL